jgi:ADP-ribosyl-[dinitrogen reductase] hydrolase
MTHPTPTHEPATGPDASASGNVETVTVEAGGLVVAIDPLAPDSPGVRQRATGAVLGSAVGDALGAPFEFGPAGAYRRAFPEPVLGGIGEMTGGGVWAPAEFTDDTAMAIVQAESLLAHGGLDEADLFAAFRSWAAGSKDVGTQTRAVLSNGEGLVARAAAEAHFAAGHRAAGNGALMRIVPTAVLCTGLDVDTTIELARATSAVTHGDPAAGWGAAIAAVMVRAGVLGEDPWAALDDVVAALPEDQSRFATMLRPGWQPADGAPDHDGRLSNGSVWQCLAEAVWAVRHHGTFAEAVVAAIDLGDDTDTVAAVAGGIAGAIHGVAAIPSRWTTYLHGTIATPAGPQRWTVDALRDLVARLLGNSHRDLNVPASLGTAEIVPGLHATNLGGALELDDDWAVVSLCLVGDRLAGHAVRREIHLIDQQPGFEGDHNLGLAHAVADAVASIDAFLAEGRQVAVHCHGGASRTGLVLRAWLMRNRAMSDAEASAHISQRWPHLSEWNRSFTAFLRHDWT